MADDLSLSTLRPADKRKARKRIGRGMGSGKGRYSGRGIKGQKSRAGSHRMRAGFEGGQMPIYMRLGKQRGNTSKDAMPVGPHRTTTQNLNVRDLERCFEAGTEVTLEVLRERGLIKSLRIDVKVLGQGELTKKLTVTAHRFSESAREKIEAAGGSVVVLREPVETTSKKARKRAAARGGPPPGADLEPETDETPAEAAEAADDAPDADAEAPSDEETTD
jgi:large subunit ribosomal protein L15